ncbi:MAG: hypothetical protein KatS3mg050_4805 [Litorilinea sp.]|nr:MAG: hypothetical protein KatS3mg050_4672 [Litorilinea sp.]GIV80411.1 MAG: hypothetical protein KatS3mg050_4805 [Litorilinea sp.]
MRKRWLWISLMVIVVPLWLTACSNNERAVRQTVEELADAVQSGLNRRNLNAVEPFFATPDEGANAAGLGETWEALQTFADQLGSSDQVQFHSFDVESVAVHEENKLARVTYRLHFSVVRNGLPIYSAVVTQNLALIRTSRGWRISGGDVPRLDDVTGQWPPRSSATTIP